MRTKARQRSSQIQDVKLHKNRLLKDKEIKEKPLIKRKNMHKQIRSLQEFFFATIKESRKISTKRR